MKKTIITVLVVILVVVGLAAAAGLGFAWYVNNHVFVEKVPYPIDAQSLDLREEDISLAHYNELQSKLPHCDILWMVPFQGGHTSSDSVSLTLKTLTEADMDMLPYFPRLQEVVADFDDYVILEALQERYPELTVTYTVSLGGTTVAPGTESLTLEVGDYDYDTLMENLKHLPSVTAITLKKPELSLEQIGALKEAYPETAFSFTVDILGKEYDDQTTQLDLSSLTAEQLIEVADKLSLLPGLTSIELMDASGASQLALTDVKQLQEAAPHAVFHYTFEFFGQTLSTDAEEIKYANKRMGDEAEAELRAILDVLPNCKRLVLDNCHLSNEVLAQMRNDYRDRTKIVWRVWFGGGSCLTDAEVIRVTYDLDNDNSKDLIYCEDVVYMDIGHDEWLRDITFVSGMPNLEVIIISGSLVADLSPFANCKKLRILEAAFCEQITDLTPLASCESLEMLNISNSHALDLSPLDNLNLTHFVHEHNPSGKSRVPLEEQERFIAQHPDCWVSFYDDQPYGSGWRYDEDNNKLPWYEEAGRQFRYPSPPNNTGWYLLPPVTEETEN